jgi:opacity protein-like surface antigen
MRMRKRLLLAVSTSLLLTPLALADLTVETKVSAAGADSSGVVKQYYKGSKVRTESKERVTIYDTATDRSVILDNDKKTYYITSVKRMQEMMKESPMGGMISKMKMTVTGDVTPGGQTKTILGKSAQNYKYTFVMNMDMSGMMEMIPEKERKSVPKEGIKTTISGELWTTKGVALTNPSAFTKGLAAMQGGGFGGVGGEQVAAKMSKVQGFTLLATQQIGVAMPKTMMKEASKSGKKPPTTAMTMRQEVISLKETSLPDTLFLPPKGYKQVPMPSFDLQNLKKMGGG